MKTNVLFFCLLTIISYGNCQISNDLDSFSMVDQFPIYNQLSHEEKLRFNKRVNDDIIHYDKQDIANLIEHFGADFYKMNDLALKELVDAYFAERFVPKHQYLPGHSGFDVWHTRLQTISEKFKYNVRKNQSFFPKEEVWDGLIYFDNLIIDSNSHWTNNDSTCSLLWDYTNAYSHLTQQPYVQELDAIYDLIDGTSNIYLRANRYMLFMRNLYSDQNWNTLVYVAQKFIDDLIEESFLLEYKLTEPEVFISKPQVILGIEKNHSYQYYTALPAPDNNSDLKEQYLTWMVATVKLLISIPSEDLGIQDHILHNFGKIAGLLDSEAQQSPLQRQIQLLELDYFKELCMINLFDEDYLPRYMEMFGAYYYASDTILMNSTDRLGMMLRTTSAIAIAMEIQYSLGLEGLDRSTFIHALTSFHASYYFNTDTSEIRIRNKQHFDLLFNLANRALVEKDYFQTQNFLYCALNLIEDNSEHFSQKQLDRVVTLLMLSYIREDNDLEAFKWADYLNFPIEVLLYSKNMTNFDNWSDNDYQYYTNVFLDASSSNSTFLNDLKQFSPIFIRILTEGERSFVTKKKYKKAYETIKLIGLLRNQTEETLPFLDNIRYQNLTNTLSKKTSHQKTLQKKYRESNSALIMEVNQRTQDLSQLQRMINRTQHELESVQDSVVVEQKRLAQVKDSVRNYRENNTKLSVNNRKLDSLNNVIFGEKRNAENLADSLFSTNTTLSERNAELRTANNLFILLSVMLSLLLIALVYLGIRFRKEKNKAIQQKNLTQTLTLGFTQMGHFGRSLINAFSKRYYGDQVLDQKDNENQSEIDELNRISTFLHGFSLTNVNNSVQQTIEKEIELAGEIVSLLYKEDYNKDRFHESYIIYDELIKENVPIYTISNLIVNSFRHSIRSCPIRFHIKTLKSNDSFKTIELRDFAQKTDPLPKKTRSVGIKFIKQMFNQYNENIPTDFSLREWHDGEESGVIAQFNLKRRK